MMIMNEKDMRIERAYLEENCPEIFENKNGIQPSYTIEEISILCRIYHICTVGKIGVISEKAEELLKTIKDMSFMGMTDVYKLNDDIYNEMSNNLIKWVSDNVQYVENFLCTLIFAYEDYNISAEDILECLNILNNVPNDVIKGKYIDLLENIKSISIENMLWHNFNSSHDDKNDVNKTIYHITTIDEFVDIISSTRDSKVITILNSTLVSILNNLPYNKTVKDIIWKGRYDGTIGAGLIAYLENDLISEYYDIRLTKAELATIAEIYLNMDFELKNNLVEELRELKYTVDFILKIFNKQSITVNICDELEEIYEVLRKERYTFDINNMTSDKAYDIIMVCYLKHKVSYLDKIFD